MRDDLPFLHIPTLSSAVSYSFRLRNRKKTILNKSSEFLMEFIIRENKLLMTVY